jgi:hypothetical protein
MCKARLRSPYSMAVVVRTGLQHHVGQRPANPEVL